ncbi:MAG TPA: Gfo/Idh/MocA family oxidoreductase [Anaerolineae bacterium]|nr:Gfo/Idh/MocA family oxidoreductase [Anaerolineae bacterium]HQI86158.1 Gfo/Idh/MocA family oxidoreductase [Anaerolineae bacterium]
MQKDKKNIVNVGIFGFAHGHVNAYCNRWREHPEMGARVVAGWDHDAARLQKNCADYGLRAYADADALLADPDVQAVIVSAETSLHADLVERAAAAGKAIVLQKPMALTLPEADRIVAAVERSGAPFTMAWQMRVDPQNVQIKALLQSGELGQVFMVRRRHGLGVHLWPNFTELWHAKPELNRDIWADDAAHAIDFILWLLGAPESVTAEIVSLHDPRVPMDNGIAIFRYPHGPLAEVSCSFVCPAMENTVEVIAEKGSIVQNYGDVPSCNVPRPADACGLKWYTVADGDWTCSDIPSPANHGERIAGLAGPLAEFLRGERPPIATAEEGRVALRMTLACYVSVREGRRVRLDDPAIAWV